MGLVAFTNVLLLPREKWCPACGGGSGRLRAPQDGLGQRLSGAGAPGSQAPGDGAGTHGQSLRCPQLELVRAWLGGKAEPQTGPRGSPSVRACPCSSDRGAARPKPTAKRQDLETRTCKRSGRPPGRTHTRRRPRTAAAQAGSPAGDSVGPRHLTRAGGVDGWHGLQRSARSSRVTPVPLLRTDPENRTWGPFLSPSCPAAGHTAENTAVSFAGDRLGLRCPSARTEQDSAAQREPGSAAGERRRPSQEASGCTGAPASPQEPSFCPRVRAARTWRHRPH